MGTVTHKRYIGSSRSEKLAAKKYDKLAIQEHGLYALTNFSYRKSQIADFLSEEDKE
jgi:hypothetical protein